jgi:hypothetical protein
MTSTPRSRPAPTGSGSPQPVSAPKPRSTPRNPNAGTAERMEHQALGDLQADLFQARVTLNQFRADLEHTCNDTRVPADDLDKVIVCATHALADPDNAISRIHRRLGPHGSAGSAR